MSRMHAGSGIGIRARHNATQRVGGIAMKSLGAGMVIRRRAGEPEKKFKPMPLAMNGRKPPDQLPACLAAAAGLSSEAVVITDSGGTVQYVNAAFERMTGFTRREMVGRSLHLLDSGRQDAAFYENIRKTLARDGIWKGRLVSRKKDGTLYYEECIHALMKSPSGQIIKHLSIRRDVTEHLKLESVAEEIDSMKNCGYILSGIRHEIGNAINSLAAILGVLKAKLAQLDTPAIAGYLESASDEAQKAAYIIHCLRNYNIYEKPEIQDVGLSEFTAKFLALTRDDFMAKGIEISASVDTDVERCYADPRALHQVMLNILINASDALAGRAHPKVSITISRSGNEVRVRVEDNGCGMSEEQLRDIFKPFYTTKAHGTGLGLAVTRKLLSAMNGSIVVTSRKDVGTVVDVIIPGERAFTGNTADAAFAATCISGNPSSF